MGRYIDLTYHESKIAYFPPPPFPFNIVNWPGLELR